MNRQNDNFYILGQKPLDAKRLKNGVPYASVAEVNATIIIGERCPYLEVVIVDKVYWYEGETLADETLVEKTTGTEYVDSDTIIFTETTAEVKDKSITLAKLEDMPALSFIGNIQEETDRPVYLDVAQVKDVLGVDLKANQDTTYTKTEVDGLVSSTFKPKGSVADYASLPTTGQKEGDVWNLLDTGGNYVWVLDLNNTGIAGWDKLAGAVDLSGYETAMESESKYLQIINVGVAVLGVVLTGLSALTSGPVLATDTILVAFGKIKKDISDIFTSLGLKQDKPLIITGGRVAVLDEVYNNVGDNSYTDPTGVEGRLYTVRVLSGVATVGGVAFGIGTVIVRHYVSGAWKNEVYISAKNQVEFSGNTTVSTTWFGKELSCMGSGILTMTSGLPDEFNFTLRAEIGVTMTWAKIGTDVWRVGGLALGVAPPDMLEGDYCQVSKRKGTNEIRITGL